MLLVCGGVELFDAMKQNRSDRECVQTKFGVYPDRVEDVKGNDGPVRRNGTFEQRFLRLVEAYRSSQAIKITKKCHKICLFQRIFRS